MTWSVFHNNVRVMTIVVRAGKTFWSVSMTEVEFLLVEALLLMCLQRPHSTQMHVVPSSPEDFTRLLLRDALLPMEHRNRF